MFKIKVTNGVHRVGPVYEEVNGKRRIVSSGRNLEKGEVFESETDLSKKFPEKYVRIDVVESSEVDSSEEDAEYAKMSVEELRRMCVELEIEVPPKTNKAQLIEKIKEASAS